MIKIENTPPREEPNNTFLPGLNKGERRLLKQIDRLEPQEFEKFTDTVRDLVDRGRTRASNILLERNKRIITALAHLPELSPEQRKIIAAYRQFHTEITTNRKTAALSQVKELMGDKMVGPDAKIFEGRDLGEIPALPANIMKILNSKCELSKGPTVAETHRLVLLPASINGVPTTVNSLRTFDAQAGKGKDPSFYKQDWYDNEAFANKPLEKSIWVLLHETVAPGTLNKTNSQQVWAIENFKNHETANVIELVGTMVFQYHENGEKIFPDVYGRCEERSPRGSPVYAGNFDADGLRVGDDTRDNRSGSLGRAVVRKLNT